MLQHAISSLAFSNHLFKSAPPTSKPVLLILISRFIFLHVSYRYLTYHMIYAFVFTASILHFPPQFKISSMRIVCFIYCSTFWFLPGYLACREINRETDSDRETSPLLACTHSFILFIHLFCLSLSLSHTCTLYIYIVTSWLPFSLSSVLLDENTL